MHGAFNHDVIGFQAGKQRFCPRFERCEVVHDGRALSIIEDHVADLGCGGGAAGEGGLQREGGRRFVRGIGDVEPEQFVAAVEAGAAMVEIGNFDAFYPQGRIFGAAEVLELTRQTRALLPEVVLSVTVPHVLPMDQQEQLAVDLVAAGVDLIQTEGGTSAKPFSAGSLGLIEKAAPTLAAAHSISTALHQAGLSTPVLCASGLSAVTVPMAIAAGASGVGVGSAVNRLSDELVREAVVRGLREALGSALTTRV